MTEIDMNTELDIEIGIDVEIKKEGDNLIKKE